MLQLILMVLAVVLIGLGARGVSAGRVNLAWAGMFCWALATLLGRGGH